MPRNHQKEVKQAALYAIFAPIVLVIYALIFPGIYFPVIAYWVALATVCLGLWLFGFVSFGFLYIQNHAGKWNTVGSAELIALNENNTTVYLGTQTPYSKSIVVDFKALPSSTHFFGRWTTYVVEDLSIELWHDHAVFGGGWYYIQY